ncbi:hypothetical protein ACFYKX_03595 [Cytobacillus sp. FJAT-54145]|uniref:Uncharacterized protein n=1 Tax=Cytobacillus spartinae TaxID=3299023 RepID=A0ABW6K9T7_9BACI
MDLGWRIIGAFVSAGITGFYGAFLEYHFRDPARPFGFQKEYLLSLLFSLLFYVIFMIWLSIAIDRLTKHFITSQKVAYVFKLVVYTAIGCLPVILTWINSREYNPDATLFYPEATYFPVASIIFFHVLLGIGEI